MRPKETEESSQDCGAAASRVPARRMRVVKGPGVAVRAPPGTKYLIYGLMVFSGNSPHKNSSTTEKRAVYICDTDVEEETADRTSITPVSAATGASNGMTSVREYNRMMDMLVSLPLGDSPEERSTVRGYTWGGNVPNHLRPHLWRLLCGYIPSGPASFSRQQAELRRKREEYDNFVSKYYKITITDFIQPNTLQDLGTRSGRQGAGTNSKLVGASAGTMAMTTPMGTSTELMAISSDDRATLLQIALDLPRHSYALFHFSRTASALARCLFLWSRRYPAVGYVQGIDDIIAVFFFVFLEGAFSERNMRHRQHVREGAAEPGDGDGARASEHAWIPAKVVYSRDMSELGAAMEQLPADLFQAAEADTYFCGGFFLSWLQDNFVHGQPGILRSIGLMEALLKAVDFVLLDSILSNEIRLMDCCFQWVHCLLARELPLELLVLLWEKYMAIGNSEAVLEFHSYVCAALMMQLRQKIVGQSVDVIIHLLKDPLEKRTRPPQGSRNKDVYDCAWLEGLISRASQLLREYPASSLT
ncbi:hypothetical protein BCY84_02938 [Trypanosoma cruzi cruzi]|nr:hypothetical protein BCY84_02938 [Trypanosoma cruzi cruzi]